MSEAAELPRDLLEHSAFVRRLARTLLRDGQAAEDIEQETWRAALERPPRGEARGWLTRVLRNFARRRWRAETRRVARERGATRDEALPAADAAPERAETLQRVVDAVRALEEPYRETILLRFYEDLPPRVIAARQGVPVETVHTRLKRGLAELHARLAREEREGLLALGLLAGESPCLPPHAGEAAPPLPGGVVLTAAVGLLVLWGAWRLTERAAPQPGSPSARFAAATPAPEGLERPSGSAGREEGSKVAVVAGDIVLAGRVLDESGAPVPEARVHVLGAQDPFGPEHPAPPIAWNVQRGRTFACDAEGRWQCVLPLAQEVLVVPEAGEAFERVPGLGDERRVSAPAEGVDFWLWRVPTGEQVRVCAGAEHAPLASFRVAHFGQASGLPGGGTEYRGYHLFSARDGVARCEHALLEPEGDVHTVELVEPSGASLWNHLGFGEETRLRQQVRLVAGTTSTVVFVLPERGLVRGQVVDAGGAPVPDALVFFGEELRLRGDEPFKPLREDRVQDGARTGADGWFELAGHGERVSAVHAQHSSATVELAEAGRIVLGPRGSLRGRVREADGRPAAGLTLRLDRRDGLECATDAEGRFEFTGVERGTHALWNGGEWPLACVRLAAGEETALELELAGPRGLALELVPAPEPESSPTQALLIGREVLFDVRTAAPGDEPGVLSLDECPRPGRYWLVTDTGLTTSLELAAGVEHVSVELGTSELRVQSPRQTSVQLVPADGDAFLRLMSARLRVRIRAGEEACFRAAPGDYVLVGEAGVVLGKVQLPSEGRTFVLP
jgi:RNA polymerase sigma factor (sigma-70 family)